jgi:hypothetical protein
MIAAAVDGALGQTAGPRGPCAWITLTPERLRRNAGSGSFRVALDQSAPNLHAIRR